MKTKILSLNEIKTQQNEKGYIEGDIMLPLKTIVQTDTEEFLDTLSEKLTGSILLENIAYKPIAIENDQIVIHVTGNAEEMLCDD